MPDFWPDSHERCTAASTRLPLRRSAHQQQGRSSPEGHAPVDGSGARWAGGVIGYEQTPPPRGLCDDRWSASLAPPTGLSGLARRPYGIVPWISVALWAELGDCWRFSRSTNAVRHAGLNVVVAASNRRRSHGHLTHQGPPCCAGRCSRPTSASRRPAPTATTTTGLSTAHDQMAIRSVAHKLARRCYHTLGAMDPIRSPPAPSASISTAKTRMFLGRPGAAVIVPYWGSPRRRDSSMRSQAPCDFVKA